MSVNLKFPKSKRLTNKNDFQNLRSGSRFFVSGPFLFYSKENSFGHDRLGLAVTKKYGKANKRNQIKRLLREYFRKREGTQTGFDILVTMNMRKINKEKLDYRTILESVENSLQKGFSSIRD